MKGRRGMGYGEGVLDYQREPEITSPGCHNFPMQWPTQFIARISDPWAYMWSRLTAAGHPYPCSPFGGQRGKGIGTQLLEAFRRRCLMEGMSTIQLEVRTTNTNAIRFYERNGFVRTEYLRSFYNDCGDGYRMVYGTPGISFTSF